MAVNTGRRFGKTVTGAAIARHAAHAGNPVAWIVPSYRNARPCWRELEESLAPVKQHLDVSKADMRWNFPSGGSISFFTDENADAMRGDKFSVVIGDECARLREETYFDVIGPTLADYNGVFFGFTTPRGRNWWWRLCQRGLDPAHGDTLYFHAPTNANPLPNIQRAFDQARSTLGESSRTFRQEWLAEFLESGGVFRNVRAVATLTSAPPKAGFYVYGVDWGRSHDFTAVSIMDAQTREQVHIERFSGIEFQQQLGRIAGLLLKWPAAAIVAERNSIGLPIIEQMNRRGWPVVAFQTTNASKAQLVDTMALALDTGNVRLQADPVLISELEAYEASEPSKTGTISYGAPSGIHDDTVMATMLSLWGVEHHKPLTTDQRRYLEGMVSF